MVAIDGRAIGGHEQHAIGIAVEGNSQFGAVLLNGCCDMREMRRAAVNVDVDAVGCTGHERHVGAEPTEEMRSDSGGGAMCTVDDDASPG